MKFFFAFLNAEWRYCKRMQKACEQMSKDAYSLPRIQDKYHRQAIYWKAMARRALES